MTKHPLGYGRTRSTPDAPFTYEVTEILQCGMHHCEVLLLFLYKGVEEQGEVASILHGLEQGRAQPCAEMRRGERLAGITKPLSQATEAWEIGIGIDYRPFKRQKDQVLRKRSQRTLR